MQQYIKYGLGIDSKYLTKEEIENIYYNEADICQTIGVQFISFTEDYEGKDWGTVVIKELGTLPHSGKMVTYQEIKQLCEKETNVSKEDQEAILEALEEYNIEHLMDKVEVVIYSRML